MVPFNELHFFENGETIQGRIEEIWYICFSNFLRLEEGFFIINKDAKLFFQIRIKKTNISCNTRVSLAFINKHQIHSTTYVNDTFKQFFYASVCIFLCLVGHSTSQ